MAKTEKWHGNGANVRLSVLRSMVFIQHLSTNTVKNWVRMRILA